MTRTAVPCDLCCIEAELFKDMLDLSRCHHRRREWRAIRVRGRAVRFVR